MRNQLIISLLCAPLLMTGCGGPDPEKAPTKETPGGAQVDLTGVRLSVSDATIAQTREAKYELSFDYTIENTSGYNIEFPCIYASMNHLIEVTLIDKDGQTMLLERGPLAELTLPQPRPRRIQVGETTRPYKVIIAPNNLQGNDPVNLRVRMHVPSRYDELRTSLEAPVFTLAWPAQGGEKKP